MFYLVTVNCCIRLDIALFLYMWFVVISNVFQSLATQNTTHRTSKTISINYDNDL